MVNTTLLPVNGQYCMHALSCGLKKPGRVIADRRLRESNSRLSLGHLSAVSRPSLGHLSATSRPSPGRLP